MSVEVARNPGAGRFRNQVMISASVTISIVMRGFSNQPTTSRSNRSSMMAKYSQPSSVHKYDRCRPKMRHPA
jgi:hypothetical protein